METSSTATGSGGNISGGVWLPKGTTLKGIMLICSSVANKKFYGMSHYFLDTPRTYLHIEEFSVLRIFLLLRTFLFLSLLGLCIVHQCP